MVPLPFFNAPAAGGAIGTILFILFLFRGKANTEKKGLFIQQRPEKKCFNCQGFGIVRCDLCSGKGFVFYEKKYQRSDPCPKCFQRRYDLCSFCQGVGKRISFNISRTNKLRKKFFIFPNYF